MRLEQREAIAAAITPTPRTRVNIAAVIEAIEAAGYMIRAPDEPLISGVAVLSETLRRDAQEALIDLAVSLEDGARLRTPTMQRAMLRRAAALRDLGLRIVSTTRADKAGARHGGAN